MRELQWRDTLHLKPVRALPWSLIGMPGRSGEELLWRVIKAVGIGIFETDLNRRRTRFSPELARQQAEKVSVTSITDRFFVLANIEDLGRPPRRTL